MKRKVLMLVVCALLLTACGQSAGDCGDTAENVVLTKPAAEWEDVNIELSDAASQELKSMLPAEGDTRVFRIQAARG